MRTDAVKILIIDDNELVRSTVRTILAAEGYKIEEAANGRSGIARAKAAPPQLILTDIVMPDIDGSEVISELRKLGHDGPIIVMSGGGRLDGAEMFDLAGKFGADACLSKPLKRAELL